MISTTAKRTSLAFILAVLVTLLVLPAAVGAAESQDPAAESSDPYTTNPTDPPITDPGGDEVVVDPASEAAAPAQTSTETLPFTGGDTVVLAAIGVGLVAAGAVLVVTRRRRSDSLA